MSILYRCFVCVWTHDAVSRGCVQIRVSHIFPQRLRVCWGMIPSTLWASCSYSIIRISNDPGWTGWGASQFPVSVLSPASSTNLGVILSPCNKLGPLSSSASWAQMWVLLPWWLPKELLEEQSYFVLWRASSRLKELVHQRGSAYQGETW